VARLFIVVVLIGIAISGIVVVALPPISRRGGARRAARSGARWAGLANFDAAACHDQAPIVLAALSGVGRLYGQRFSHRPDQRPVGGHLYVFADRLEWRPWFYLGRGKARPWTLPRRAVTGWDVEKIPFPAVVGYDAVFDTADGPIRCIVVDGEGLRSAFTEGAVT
jgi:hypothetical protein